SQDRHTWPAGFAAVPSCRTGFRGHPLWSSIALGQLRSREEAPSPQPGVSPNSSPSAVIASPSCALSRISYKLGMIHTPFRRPLVGDVPFFTASALSAERGDVAGWDGAADIGRAK